MSIILRWTPEMYEAYLKKQRPKQDMRGVDMDAVYKQPAVVAEMARKESKIERRLDQQITERGLPLPQRNYFFLPDRDFELDFAWPLIKVGVEVQGMAHRIKGKFKRDIEKRALAMLAGWRVLEVDGATVRDGRAIKWLTELMGEYGQVCGRTGA